MWIIKEEKRKVFLRVDCELMYVEDVELESHHLATIKFIISTGKKQFMLKPMRASVRRNEILHSLKVPIYKILINYKREVSLK